MKIYTKDDQCSGCRVCQGVCALENHRSMNPTLAAIGIDGLFPAPGKYHINVCNQCGQCAEVCPVGAIYQNDDGVYVINAEECTGCHVCVDSCPSGTMFTHKSMDVPIKCTVCGECVKLCPRQVLALTE